MAKICFDGPGEPSHSSGNALSDRTHHASARSGKAQTCERSALSAPRTGPQDQPDPAQTTRLWARSPNHQGRRGRWEPLSARGLPATSLHCQPCRPARPGSKSPHRQGAMQHNRLGRRHDASRPSIDAPHKTLVLQGKQVTPDRLHRPVETQRQFISAHEQM